MEGGLYFRWGKPVRGYEREALALFTEAMQYWNEKLDAGVITWFEPFIFETADFEEEAGFWVIKGPEERIAMLWHEPQFLTINSKAGVYLQHFTVGTLRVGEGLTEFMEHLGKVYAEIGV
jgi:hypothetical protein